MRIFSIVFFYSWTLLLLACGERDDTAIQAETLPADIPNTFLQFINTQASLPVGDYDIVAATNSVGESGAYTLKISYEDGKISTLNGVWTSSSGASPVGVGNPHHSISLTRAGGINITLSSNAASPHLYLMRNGNIIDESSGSAGRATIDKAFSLINSASYANAYYKAVDPDNQRLTLEDWKKLNGFEQGYDAHATFRDAVDLGYGRDMFSRKNTDGTIAIYVNNYIVETQPGSSSNYGPLNVEAAIANNKRYLIGTNAIEFSTNPSNPLQKIAKFFIFAPSENGVSKRIVSADLDGRGVKYMPSMCWSCHGGEPLPLSNGIFQSASLRSAKLQPIDVSGLEFSSKSGYQRKALEDELRIMNSHVYETLTDMKMRQATEQGHWAANFAIELAEGRYSGNFVTGRYDDSFVPTGWRQTDSRPAGVESLFKEVVEPHCIGCHALQGSTAGETLQANSINFSSYEKFISYRDEIKDYVYQRGIMPLSLRNYEKFWKDPNRAPALLASFLNDSSLFDSRGGVVQPGLAIAKLSSSRTVKSPIQLDASNSLFASIYSWKVDKKPIGSTALLSDKNAIRPLLSVNMDGEYDVSLTVSGLRGNSSSVTQHITAKSSQKPFTFTRDIVPILNSCTSCHNDNSNLPVSWQTDDQLYSRVMARVNLKNPEISKLLTKPISNHHGGGVQIDINKVDGQMQYNALLNWINEGAIK